MPFKSAQSEKIIEMSEVTKVGMDVFENMDRFVRENKYCILQIPSAVTQGDFNLLINPYHPEFSSTKVVSVSKFPFNIRIFQ